MASRSHFPRYCGRLVPSTLAVAPPYASAAGAPRPQGARGARETRGYGTIIAPSRAHGSPLLQIEHGIRIRVHRHHHHLVPILT